MSGDRYRTLTGASVLLVAGIAATISYMHIARLALAYGQEPVAAYLLPISIDGVVATSSLVMLRAARAGVDSPWLARAGLVLSIMATLGANVMSGLGHGWPGALLAGWPAVGFILSAETAIGMSRRTQSHAVSDPAAEPIPAVIAPAAIGSVTGAAADHAPRQPKRSKHGRSRVGGSLAHRQAMRAELEAEAVALLAAEPRIGTTEMARRLSCSPSTATRLKAALRATGAHPG
jgi:Protein of unknown function (DUF2637)